MIKIGEVVMKGQDHFLSRRQNQAR